MARTRVVFFQEADGSAPVRDWLRHLRDRDQRAHARCMARVERLAELGHELRRPEADYVCDGIYELRARRGRVNYRILYFFLGRGMAVLAHALTKEDAIDPADVERALARRALAAQDPFRHLHSESP